MNKYRMGKIYNPTARHNIETWKNIRTELERYAMVDYDTLVSLSINHSHPAGGRAFVDYCIEYGWLSKVKK